MAKLTDDANYDASETFENGCFSLVHSIPLNSLDLFGGVEKINTSSRGDFNGSNILQPPNNLFHGSVIQSGNLRPLPPPVRVPVLTDIGSSTHSGDQYPLSLKRFLPLGHRNTPDIEKERELAKKTQSLLIGPELSFSVERSTMSGAQEDSSRPIPLQACFGPRLWHSCIGNEKKLSSENFQMRKSFLSSASDVRSTNVYPRPRQQALTQVSFLFQSVNMPEESVQLKLQSSHSHAELCSSRTLIAGHKGAQLEGSLKTEGPHVFVGHRINKPGEVMVR
ncbi:unnamed protein product [Protopolystoma xenopodis]|uniref:Uncharacterized protein n=1 Tax=Protopolystoma xenopodis TaxID=117903 RepID=A0A3S5AJ91_9PLAT|nr:unnamed protein product [Protopolystoma xenopodis]